MRGWACRIVAGAVLLSASTALAGDPSPRPARANLPPRTKDFQEKIDSAVAGGVAWLRKQIELDRRVQRSDPEQWGEALTALSLTALWSCGASVDDPVLLHALQRLRFDPRTKAPPFLGAATYGVSLSLLALEARSFPAAGVPALSESERALVAQLVDYLVEAQTPEGGFSYRAPAHLYSGGAPRWDNSNSQFALLGLAAGRRLGRSAPPEVWRRALRHWLDTQETRGPWLPRYEDRDPRDPEHGKSLRIVGRDRARGWRYDTDERSPGVGSTMTAGGVSSIALCREALAGEKCFDAKLDRESETSLRDGISWLGQGMNLSRQGFEEPRGPPRPGETSLVSTTRVPQCYLLYGLERAGVLSGTARAGDRDWYGEGVQLLLETQERTGCWNPSGGGTPLASGRGKDAACRIDTCFALLFLRRATERVRTGTSTPR